MVLDLLLILKKASNIWIRYPNNPYVYNFIELVTGAKMTGTFYTVEQSKKYHNDFLKRINRPGKEMNDTESIKKAFNDLIAYEDYIQYFQKDKLSSELNNYKESFLNSIKQSKVYDNQSIFNERHEGLKIISENILVKLNTLEASNKNMVNLLNVAGDVLFIKFTHYDQMVEANDDLSNRGDMIIKMNSLIKEIINYDKGADSWDANIDRWVSELNDVTIEKSTGIEKIYLIFENKKNIIGEDLEIYKNRLYHKVSNYKTYYGKNLFTNGFFSLHVDIVNGIINKYVTTPVGKVDIKWGGHYSNTKDFMHFEIRPLPGDRSHQVYLHKIPISEIKKYLNSFNSPLGSNYNY